MKLVKKASITVGIIAAIMVIMSGLYGLKMRSELGKMRPDDTKEIIEGIYVIKDDTYINMHLIKVDNGYVAIDAAQHEKIVKRELNKLNIDPERVIAVFLTHSDYDHVGAVMLFRNAEVYISVAEEQMINGKTARAAFIHRNKLNSDYQLIEDNQTIDIAGLKVKGILTPGHTPGSMCYLINDKYLFTGDTLNLKDQKVEVFNEFFNMDTATNKKSIKKLATLPGIKYIFTAHYGSTDNVEKAFEDWKSQ